MGIIKEILPYALICVALPSAILLEYRNACKEERREREEKSALTQKILATLTSAVFRNDDGTTRTLYAHQEPNGQYTFSFNPETPTTDPNWMIYDSREIENLGR